MRISRRRFVETAAAAAVATAVAISAKTSLTGATEPKRVVERRRKDRRWVMVIDLERCDGCKKCTDACIEEHYVPPAWGEPNHNGHQEWIKVLKLTENREAGAKFQPTPCMNCQNAPCVKVCPVGATYYNEDRIVLIDNTRCIGCRICMAACPYDRRHFNWGEPPALPEQRFIQYSPEYSVPHRRGTVEKCMFCAHRLKMGRLPACVEACFKQGMKAIYFGDANEDTVTNGEEIVKFSTLVASRGGYRLKDHLGTQPSVYYLPPRGR